MKIVPAILLPIFVSIAGHASDASPPLGEFPVQLNCAEFVNYLSIRNRAGKWYATNSNHFSDSKHSSVVGEVEVEISPTAFVGQYLVSAMNQNLNVATSHQKNFGDLPFRDLLITLSRDHVASPTIGRLNDQGSVVTYACCPGTMRPPERGQGLCRL